MAARTNDDGFVVWIASSLSGATLKGEERKAVTLGECERVPHTVAVFLVGVVPVSLMTTLTELSPTASNKAHPMMGPNSQRRRCPSSSPE